MDSRLLAFLIGLASPTLVGMVSPVVAEAAPQSVWCFVGREHSLSEAFSYCRYTSYQQCRNATAATIGSCLQDGGVVESAVRLKPPPRSRFEIEASRAFQRM
jgi:hypothetical protein